MTKKFDDMARESLKNIDYIDSLQYNGIPVKDMVVKEVSVKFARPYIATFHYSQTMPDSTLKVYAGYLGDKLAGIVVYGMGAGSNQYKSILPDIKKGEYAELTRLWSPDSMPKNTESKLIAESIKLLPKDIKLLISFADPSQGHLGIIYQSTNWLYCGLSNGGKSLITQDGTTQHPRLIGIYKMRHPELKDKTTKEIMDIYGWRYEQSSGKHRYVKFRGSKKELKEMYRQIKDKILPYPKEGESKC